MRTAGREVFYGGTRAADQQYEKPGWTCWQKVRESVEVKLFARRRTVRAGEERRGTQGTRMRRRKLVRLLKTCAAARSARRAINCCCGSARKKRSRTCFGFVLCACSRGRGSHRKLSLSVGQGEIAEVGITRWHYLLRSNLLGKSWKCSGKCTFSSPDRSGLQNLEERTRAASIYHQVEKRVEATSSWLSCLRLSVTLKHGWLPAHRA